MKKILLAVLLFCSTVYLLANDDPETYYNPKMDQCVKASPYHTMINNYYGDLCYTSSNPWNLNERFAMNAKICIDIDGKTAIFLFFAKLDNCEVYRMYLKKGPKPK